MLTENELYKLQSRAKWDDERGDWSIPLFTFNPKSKDISFPTINAKSRIEQAKDERELTILAPDPNDYDENQFRQQNNFGDRAHIPKPKNTASKHKK